MSEDTSAYIASLEEEIERLRVLAHEYLRHSTCSEYGKEGRAARVALAGAIYINPEPLSSEQLANLREKIGLPREAEARDEGEPQ